MNYRVLFGLVLAGLLGTSSARAETTFVFDENGNWSKNGVAQTPASLVGGVLTYDLGVGNLVAAGDVQVKEPLAGGNLSDVLRFSQQGTHVLVSVYSDQGTPAPNLADQGGLPTPTGDFSKNEIGIPKGTPYVEDGSNGIDYKPSSSTNPPQPGYVTGTPGGFTDAHYIFISDTPEPTTVVLAGLGGLGLAGYGLRRRKIALA